MSDQAQSYITGAMHGVKGYLTQADAQIWRAVCQHQSSTNVTGSLAEIGIFFGRSYILLEHLRQKNEALFGNDLFTVPVRGNGSDKQFDVFAANVGKLAPSVDLDNVFIGDSAGLDLSMLRERFGDIRFISIDGGHYLEHIRTDGAIAECLLHDAGVISFDDFCNPEWPEVTFGVFEFMEKHKDDLSMFAVSRKKAYACRRDFADTYAKVVREAAPLAKCIMDVKYFDRTIPFVSEPYTVLVRQKLNDIAGRGLISVL